MSVVLPAFPRPLPDLVADPGSVTDTATGLLAASARLDDVGDLARGPGALPTWEGRAGEAYRADLGPATERSDALSLALRSVGRRVEDHATALADLLAERAGLAAANHALVQDRFDLETRAAAPAGSAALQAEADHLAGRVRVLDLRQVDWWRRVVAEEDAVIAALLAVLDADRAHRRWAGVPDPADAALAVVPPPGSAPERVLAWWRGLTEAQRLALLVAAPGAVGGLAGVPAVARDRANRLRLARDLATLRHLQGLGQLTRREQGTLANAEATQAALAEHEGHVDADGDPVPVLLWTYDPGAFVQPDGDVDGRVAISLGDPDRADSTAVNVPGIGTEADDISEHTDRAWELHQAATTADPDRTYASIAWLGYDAPGELGGPRTLEAAAGAGAATRGGSLLAASLDGLRAVRGDDGEIVPVGHSYGSVTLGAALGHHDVDVDRAAAVGSPGMGEGIDGAGDLHLPAGAFYVGQSADDLVAGLGQNGVLGLGGAGHGQDPADAGFGGVRFQANAAPGHDGHSAYYDNDSESLHNLGAVVAGTDPTPAGPVRDPWFGPAVDPEDGAPSDAVDTDGDGDTDGVPG